MTDALNPSLPVGANQVQIASELRGIKSRLVTDKANIEALQVLTTPLASMGAIGALVLAAANTNTAQTVIGGTTVGKGVFGAVDQAAARAALGVMSSNEVITTSFGGKKGTITFSGGFKIKWTEELIASGGGGQDVTFDTAFATSIFGVHTGFSGNSSSTNVSCWVNGAPTLGGVNVDHGAGSAKYMITFGYGI